jgi:hypothetical protein
MPLGFGPIIGEIRRFFGESGPAKSEKPEMFTNS